MDRPYGRTPNTTAMSYQVYFADLTEENKALILTLLRLKAESGRLEPEEREMLTRIRGSESRPAPDHVMPRRGSGGRRRASNGQVTNGQSAERTINDQSAPPLTEEATQPQPTDDEPTDD